ncbi:MAG: DUF6494 family protein [Aquisalimonadaceae bacterium]
MVDQDALNMQIRKFLKQVGVTSQREIEQALSQAVESGRLQGSERLSMTMTLTVDGLSLSHSVQGELDLSQ